ncbi:amylo-alpha-1,6-glucosidase [Thiocapsa marina]|uniref:Amylo-alpha-16-glucosidase n=1 Tax=Thiocapsa marina 5811 TaxID=768671 RepID=F9UF64_9GAMM|nr:amylo-alpha-1,6-glucosidase [Thiocapsa marina]EGV17101.1 Amylo-alpha-16-glucosidase [Thiocapsa marina 5811]
MTKPSAELDRAEHHEWWITNGRGGYAAGTVAGSLTRGYHGLLTATIDPPLGRRLQVAKLDATLIDGERHWPLFTNRWADGCVEPDGHSLIDSFRLDGRMPVWSWACGDLLVEQRIWMPPGEDSVWSVYRLVQGRTDAAPRLRIALLLADRDHHHIGHRGDFDPILTLDGDARLTARCADGHDIHLMAFGARMRIDRAWIERFDLPIERERGLPDRQDLLRVGFAELSLSTTAWRGVSATVAPETETGVAPDPEQAFERFRQQDRALVRTARTHLNQIPDVPAWIEQLILAADSFLIERPIGTASARQPRPAGMSVVAGYPWFGDWGRDTMIALPGLTLATGRPEIARRILETFAGFVDRGMLPNRFPGAGETPVYNTVDAALWSIDAWRAYIEASDDLAALARVFPILESIVAHYREGTRYGIGMDPSDGLIRAGEPGVQLTWMDAKVDDWVVTPRIGKPVEINALWYHGLRVMADFAERLGRDPQPYRRAADRAQTGFTRFLRPDGTGLYDVIDGPDGNDSRIRPNQIFAVSLTHSSLDPPARASVVEVCARHLLCPFGLRSLAQEDPEYRGRYEGDVRHRDAAYHQGTVWAWLLGHYALAEYRVTGDAAAAQARLDPIPDHLRDGGVGTVAEIFDGDPPHRPRGCPAQAWSVACILDAWTRLERIRVGKGSTAT